MINIRNNLNEMFEFANNDLDGGEDLEDGEIFDDEAEPEEKPEAPAKVEIQKNSSTTPSANTAAPVAKAVLKNDAYNVHDKTEKKNDKFSNNRWTDENSKKEEKNSGHFDGEKRFKEKKMKRKKPKEEDSENDGPAKFKGKKRKTSFERELEKLEDSDYIDEDDEEMLNIRGASPSRWLDIFSDEEDQSFDVSEGGRGGGGGGRENMRGGAARRRGVGFRGGRIDRNARRERIERMSSRGKRRGKGAGMRGGKKRADEKEICIYHMQGKCHRGNECPFSHDAMPPRKMELCKFYLMDCCAKKDKCLYMHSEFPCKYFHTGLKCFAGKNCKFSHGKLTDNLRAILNKTYGPSGIATNELTSKHQEETGFQRQHLETAPKEILGDFPRLREATRNLKKDMKIPSLFDIKVSPPRDMRSQSDSDGNHTPMPSPTHQPNNKEFFRESMEREHTPPSAVERRRGEHHHKTDRSGKTHSQRKEARRSERAERAERLERTDRFEEGGSRSSRERRDKAGGRRSSRDDEQHHDARLSSHANNSSGATGQLMNNNSRRQASYSPPPNYEEEPPVNERLKAPEPDQSSNDFLSHLPKKQRELFIRIQQQQRQAENSQESNPEDEDEDKDYKQEENWYSSDEESTPLTTILKTINIQKTSSMAASTTSSQSPNQNQHHQQRHHHHHHHHHHQQSHSQVSEDHQQQSPTLSSSALPVSIPDIDFGDVSALLSKVKQHIQTTADKLKVRDPRLRSDQEPSEKQQHHSVSSSSEHAHNEPHAPAHARNAHAPGQLSPSISAILNSATASTRHQQHNHHHHHSSRSSPSHSSSHHSFPPPTPSLNSRSSPSHHHSSSFPPPTPSLNFDDDEDGISSPDADDMSADENMSLSSLPFKPAPVHSAANEIDASINSHAPIVYRLVPLVPSKPDYSALQTMPKGGALDPRWRKAVRFNEESGLASRRDPRHRLADDTPRPAPSSSSSSSSTTHAPADPRQRLSAMMNNNSTGNSLLPPPTPRYDDDHAPLNVAGMRTSNFPAQMDVSAAMFCPPTPRMDDEPPASLQPPQQQQQQQMMSANIRPTDPRQRQHMMNNMNQQQQAMPSIGNMYDQIRQQQMQFMPNQQSMMYDPSRGMYGNDMSANINRQPQYNNYK